MAQLLLLLTAFDSLHNLYTWENKHETRIYSTSKRINNAPLRLYERLFGVVRSSDVFSLDDRHENDDEDGDAPDDTDHDESPVLHQVLPRQVAVLHFQVHSARDDVRQQRATESTCQIIE